MAAETARDRIARVFSFLEALHQHRSPVVGRTTDRRWLLPLDRLPDHPSIEVGKYEDYDPDGPDEGAIDYQGSKEKFVLKVRRPVLTGPPPVPNILGDWLAVEDKGWDDPFEEAEPIGTITWDEEGGGQTEEEFEESPARVKAFDKWSRERAKWAAEETGARKAYWVYEQLYELHGILERESERVELMLGDGVLRWRGGPVGSRTLSGRRGPVGPDKRVEEQIEHPILLDRVQLLFDPSVPEFTVTDVGTEVELYAALLRSIPGVEGPTISKFQEELERGFYHPLGGDATTEFLRRIAVRLSRHGRLVREEGASLSPRVAEHGEPEISRTPVLFLRKREHGFAAAIQSVRRDIEGREDIPVSLLQGESLMYYPSAAVCIFV